ncbi:low-density lipoprotein receptor-related protein 1B-like isoform X2 [Babylonia areolata]|uniref:low-density lipoprotein receptor-related protein 1B-like isoform X2 n=1 Tax=Babylonia areolata TaxID=304850 RepID=UPI003FD46C59
MTVAGMNRSMWQLKFYASLLLLASSLKLPQLSATESLSEINACELWGACSQNCTFSGGKQCSCFPGYELGSDKWSCKALGDDPIKVIYSNTYGIRQLNTKDMSAVSLMSGLRNIVALDFYWEKKYLFWTGVVDDKIYRGTLAPNSVTDIQAIVDVGLAKTEGVAVDWVGGNIYWVEARLVQIEVAKLNGTHRTTLVAGGAMSNPRAIGLDPRVSLLFWTDWDSEFPRIERCSMSGDTDTRKVIYDVRQIPGGGWLNGLTVDYEAYRLYWVDARSDSIHSITYDGDDHHQIMVSRPYLGHLFSISLFEDSIYLTDWHSKALVKANKFNRSNGTVIQKFLLQPFDVKIFHPYRQPQVPHNPCDPETNGGCSHLCLLGNDDGKLVARCRCPYRWKLNADNKTCSEQTAFLLYAKENEIRGVDLSAAYYNVIPALTEPIVKNAPAIDYDVQSDRLYWTDRKRHVITSAFLNGTGVQTIIDKGLSNPEGFAIDWLSRNMYFTSYNQVKASISVARLDGAFRTEIVTETNRSKLNSIAVHPRKGLMFWSVVDGKGHRIMRANMDGTSITEFVSNTQEAASLTLDLDDERLYWVSRTKTPKVFYCQLSENNKCDATQYQTPGISDPFSLTIHRKMAYYASSSKIMRVDLRGKGSVEDLRTVTPHVSALQVYDPSLRSGTNKCSKNNGGCQQLCLPHRNGCQCHCTAGFTLDKDEQSCITTNNPSGPPTNGGCSHLYQVVNDDGKLVARCLCPHGWKLLSDNKTCSNMHNPCGQATSGGCSHLCQAVNDNGKLVARCLCPHRWKLLSDNKTCSKINACELWGACSQNCTFSGGKQCSCFPGYELGSDKWSCKALGDDPIKVIFTQRHEIRQINMEDMSAVSLVTGQRSSIAVDFYWEKKYLYWTDVFDDKIYRGTIMSNSVTNIQAIVDVGLAAAEGVAVDWVGGNIYWVEARLVQIEVARLNGTHRTTLVAGGAMSKPRGIGLDPRVSLMFWSDWDREFPQIERCSMSGETDTRKVIYDVRQIPGGGVVNGLTVDYEAYRLYWVDARSDSIHSITYDGDDHQQIVVSGPDLRHLFSISLFEDSIYLTDWYSNALVKANKFNGSDGTVIEKSNLQLYDVKIFHPYRQPQVPHNPCDPETNGGCSHLCLLGNDDGKLVARCRCPYRWKLNADNKTCSEQTAFLLYTNENEIRGVDLSAAYYNVIPALTESIVKNAPAIDYDVQSDRLYWTDINRKVISSAFLNGTGVQTIIDTGLSNPEGFAIDWLSRNMYFTSYNQVKASISVARLDGAFRTEIVTETNRSKLNSIAVHPKKGVMFWSVVDGKGHRIMRANMDGSNVTEFVSNTSNAASLTLDLDHERLYWVSRTKTPKVFYCQLSENNKCDATQYQTPGISDPFSLTIHRKMAYYASSSKIVRVDLGGKGRVEDLRTVTPHVPALQVYDPSLRSGVTSLVPHTTNKEATGTSLTPVKTDAAQPPAFFRYLWQLQTVFTLISAFF